MEAFKVLSVMAGNDFPVHLVRVKGRTCQKSSILWVPDEGDSDTDEEEKSVSTTTIYCSIEELHTYSII